METKRIKIEDPAHVRDEELSEAARILREGGLVAFPTETVYGLGANALNEEAAKKIYAAKGRPSDNPLIAHISCMEELPALVTEIPEAAKKLAAAYWPGPMTLIFPKSAQVPYGTTGGLDTVAVRMPSDPVANRLIRLAGVPVAAPSANTSGRPSPTRAEHVWQDMNGRIEMILDGGPVGIGVESTIVDVSGEIPTLLRPGAITLEMLRETMGRVDIDPAIQGPPKEGLRPKAPGMKYRHYAPRAAMTLVEGGTEKTVARIRELAAQALAEGKKVGVICTDETRDSFPENPADLSGATGGSAALSGDPAGAGNVPGSVQPGGGTLTVKSVGVRAREETIAHNLFAVLRDFDDLGVDVIFSESFAADHLGLAIMNRLDKAAGYHIEKV